MRFIDKFKNYRLRYREKFNNSYHRQLMRLIRMTLGFPSRSIKNGMIKAMINLTYRCQCDCNYCWCGSYERQTDNELTFLELKQLIHQIAQFPSFFTLVSFIGGEPLLRDDIYRLINYASREGLFTEMETNGILLSLENVKRLKEAGLNHIFVRIEGSNKERHDSISKIEGCFEKAIEGIKNCIREKLSCSVFMNASKEKIREGELEKIVNIARHLKAVSARIIHPTLGGRWLNEENQKLSFEEERQVQKLLEPDFVYLESSYSCTKESNRFCSSLQKKFFHISCYGEVQLCPFVPLSFGNLRFDTLKNILEKMWSHNIFFTDYEGCLMNNPEFREKYIIPFSLKYNYQNIIL